MANPTVSATGQRCTAVLYEQDPAEGTYSVAATCGHVYSPDGVTERTMELAEAVEYAYAHADHCRGAGE